MAKFHWWLQIYGTGWPFLYTKKKWIFLNPRFKHCNTVIYFIFSLVFCAAGDLLKLPSIKNFVYRSYTLRYVHLKVIIQKQFVRFFFLFYFVFRFELVAAAIAADIIKNGCCDTV